MYFFQKGLVLVEAVFYHTNHKVLHSKGLNPYKYIYYATCQVEIVCPIDS